MKESVSNSHSLDNSIYRTFSRRRNHCDRSVAMKVGGWELRIFRRLIQEVFEIPKLFPIPTVVVDADIYVLKTHTHIVICSQATFTVF